MVKKDDLLTLALISGAASLLGVTIAQGQIGDPIFPGNCYTDPPFQRSCCSLEQLDEGRMCEIPNNNGGSDWVFCGDEILGNDNIPQYRRASTGWATTVSDSVTCLFIEKVCVTETGTCDQVCPVACISTCSGAVPNTAGNPCDSSTQ